MNRLLRFASILAVVFVAGCRESPFYAEVPSGPHSGRAGVPLAFASSATAADGDSVAVRFDWDDGDTSDWSDWLASGDTSIVSHSWAATGTYSVRAQAKKASGAVSDWSNAVEVAIVDAWTQTFGGSGDDEGFAATQCSDGGYFLAGLTFSYGRGAGDIYVIKADAAGAKVWVDTIGTTGYDAANSVIPTSDGGCVVAGTIYYDALDRSDAYLAKLDASGVTVLAKNFGWIGADMARSVQPASDGSYIMVGQTGSFGAGGYDVYLIKVSVDFGTRWYQVFGGAYDDIGYSVQQTSDGGYVIAGQTDPGGHGVPDIYLIRTDTAGNQVWTKTYDNGGHDYAYAVESTLDGGFIIAGQTEVGSGSYAYLLRTDANGNKVWDKTYGTNGGEMARAVQRTTDGGYVVVGATASVGAGSYDVYLFKTNSTGDTLWTRTFGGPQSDAGYSVEATSDGGYIIAGETESSGAGGRDAWLIKTDSQGRVGGK